MVPKRMYNMCKTTIKSQMHIVIRGTCFSHISKTANTNFHIDISLTGLGDDSSNI